MAYFNHAFCKTFLATKPDNAAPNAATVGGLLDTASIHVSELKNSGADYQLGPGVTGFFNAKTNESIAPAGLAAVATAGTPFYVAASSIKLNDKQGPHHGGYQESNKSKVINPKYLRKMWSVPGNAASRAVLNIGWNPAQADEAATNPACAKDFLCGEDYNLRLEAKGHDALRFANHNLYQTLNANGGCCDGAPVSVDAGTIYLQWAEQLIDNAYLKDFMRPIIVAKATIGGLTGDYFFAETVAILEEENIAAVGDSAHGGTFATLKAGIADGSIVIEDTGVGTSAYKVGMILLGAYEETTFKDCTFTPSDYYSVEPILLFASEVDLNGDPCTFEGLCVESLCPGVQLNGSGELVAREVILHESYLQNFMHDDLRIREITQGDQLWDVPGFVRSNTYDRHYILHSVPRYNNPSGVFDNDQYLLCIISDTTFTALDTTFAAVATALSLDYDATDYDSVANLAAATPTSYASCSTFDLDTLGTKPV